MDLQVRQGGLLGGLGSLYGGLRAAGGLVGQASHHNLASQLGFRVEGLGFSLRSPCLERI